MIWETLGSLKCSHYPVFAKHFYFLVSVYGSCKMLLLMCELEFLSQLCTTKKYGCIGVKHAATGLWSSGDVFSNHESHFSVWQSDGRLWVCPLPGELCIGLNMTSITRLQLV